MNSGNKVIKIILLVLSIISVPLACTYAIAGLALGLISFIAAWRYNKTSRCVLTKISMIISFIGCVIAVCSMLFMVIFYIMVAM